jgi:hypothetical protein
MTFPGFPDGVAPGGAGGVAARRIVAVGGG